MNIVSNVDCKEYFIKGYWLVYESLQALPEVCPNIPIHCIYVYLDPYEGRVIAHDPFWDDGLACVDPLWIMVGVYYTPIPKLLFKTQIRRAMDWFIYNYKSLDQN